MYVMFISLDFVYVFRNDFRIWFNLKKMWVVYVMEEINIYVILEWY